MQHLGWRPERTPQSGARHQRVLGWSCSVAFHGLILVGVMAVLGRVHLHPPAESFRWDVALIEPAIQNQPMPKKQASTRPAAPAHMPQAARSDTRLDHLQSTPADSMAMREPAQPVKQPVQQAIQRQTVPLVTQAAATPLATQSAVTPAAIHRSNTPIVNQGEAIVHQATASTTLRESGIERQVIHTTEGARQFEQPSHVRGPITTHSVVSRTAMASIPQHTAEETDYSWLATTLWKRVHELKRYPSKAAADRLEGDVLLAAVVHADGAIAEIRVTESSGYPLLDQAAVEAVRNASPLTLLRPLNHAQVSVEIPIAYHRQN